MATPTSLPATFTSGQVLTAAQMNDLRGAFRILQVVSTTKTDTFSASLAAGAEAAITGLTASITPSSTDSEIFALVNVNGAQSTGQYEQFGVRLYRDSTEIGSGTASGDRTTVLGAVRGPNTAQAATIGNVVGQYLDSPATISALVYSVYLVTLQSSTATHVVNRSADDSDARIHARTSSSITLLEVSA